LLQLKINSAHTLVTRPQELQSKFKDPHNQTLEIQTKSKNPHDKILELEQKCTKIAFSHKNGNQAQDPD
jgi:hypothetical protein